MKFEGEFFQGQMHGHGTVYNRDGTVQASGPWTNNGVLDTGEVTRKGSDEDGDEEEDEEEEGDKKKKGPKGQDLQKRPKGLLQSLGNIVKWIWPIEK